ncbi:MAG: SOS response-associated peptidase [Bacteroidetes bacterium]|nr:SOS response-associated peptidase [Bacteroidota bacterium]
MCGRASLTKVEKELEERFNATFYTEDTERYNPLPNYNVAPTHMHPLVTNTQPERLQYFKWGLIPFWAKDKKIGYRMINARVETVAEKPAYRAALQKRRCLVPFDGFYEWKKVGKNKIPHRITLITEEIFSVAGLWECWKSPEGEDVFSFTLITQPPNELLSSIHNRMPAILLPEQESTWLANDLPAKEALKLINPYPDELLRAYPVSSRVNKVSENDVDIIAEIS